MKKEEVEFTLAFAVSLVLLLYFMGASVTGFVTQSMYCMGGACKEFCETNSDCALGSQVCCNKGSFGACEPTSQCFEPYVFQPGTEINIKNLPPALETPSSFESTKTIVFVGLVLLATIIGLLYLLGSKAKIKRKKATGKKAAKKKTTRRKTKKKTR